MYIIYIKNHLKYVLEFVINLIFVLMKILFRNIVFFSVLCVFFSCKKDQKENIESNIENEETVVLSKLPGIGKLTPEAKNKTSEWQEFKKLEDGIQRIYEGGDNLTEAEATLASFEEIFVVSKFPEEFDIPAIKTRFLVLKTFLLQFKAAAVEDAPNAEVHQYKIKIIESYNSLLVQLNEALSKSIAEDFLKKE